MSIEVDETKGTAAGAGTRATERFREAGKSAGVAATSPERVNRLASRIIEAANDIVDRAISLIGNPNAKSQDRTGLIWHTQGSGKSLTMIYAGMKLRRHRKLNSPTVLVVVDRSDLKRCTERLELLLGH